MNNMWLGTIYVAFAAIMWSTGGLFIKAVPADPILISALRSAIAGLALLPFLRIKHIKVTKNLCLYILAYTWLVVAFCCATKFTTAANAIALQNTAPLFIFLYITFIKKEKPEWQSVVPVVFIALGIICVLSEPKSGSSFLGNLIALSSGIAFAAMTLNLRQLSWLPGMSLVSLSNLMSALLILPFAPQLTINIGLLTTGSWLRLLYLGVFQIGLSYVLYATGLKYIKPLRASVLALLEAVLNPIWVLIFWGEKPSIYGLTGGILILLAVTADLVLRNTQRRYKESI